jgi:hypothetical protein
MHQIPENPEYCFYNSDFQEARKNIVSRYKREFVPFGIARHLVTKPLHMRAHYTIARILWMNTGNLELSLSQSHPEHDEIESLQGILHAYQWHPTHAGLMMHSDIKIPDRSLIYIVRSLDPKLQIAAYNLAFSFEYSNALKELDESFVSMSSLEGPSMLDAQNRIEILENTYQKIMNDILG